MKYLTIRQVKRIIALADIVFPPPDPARRPTYAPTRGLFRPGWATAPRKRETRKQKAARAELTAMFDAMSNKVKTDLMALMSLGRDLVTEEYDTFEYHRECVGERDYYPYDILIKGYNIQYYLRRGLERLAAKPKSREPQPNDMGEATAGSRVHAGVRTTIFCWFPHWTSEKPMKLDPAERVGQHHAFEDHPEDIRPKGRERECRECQQTYTIEEAVENNPEYFPAPYDYERGCTQHCLACWLGVGPND